MSKEQLSFGACGNFFFVGIKSLPDNVIYTYQYTSIQTQRTTVHFIVENLKEKYCQNKIKTNRLYRV